MKQCKDRGYEESDNFLCLEDCDYWLRFELRKRRLGIDKSGDVYLTPKQAVGLAKKILKFYKRPK